MKNIHIYNKNRMKSIIIYYLYLIYDLLYIKKYKKTKFSIKLLLKKFELEFIDDKTEEEKDFIKKQFNDLKEFIDSQYIDYYISIKNNSIVNNYDKFYSILLLYQNLLTITFNNHSCFYENLDRKYYVLLQEALSFIEESIYDNFQLLCKTKNMIYIEYIITLINILEKYIEKDWIDIIKNNINYESMNLDQKIIRIGKVFENIDINKFEYSIIHKGIIGLNI